MKIGVLAICDANEDYANRLMEYISDKNGMPFRTLAFTQKDELLQFTETNHVDILLISGMLMEEEIADRDVKKIILLSSGEVEADFAEYDSIYKYQSSEEIVREILDYYVDVFSDNEEFNMDIGKAEVISVYSPAGRVGKTTFALTLGQVMAEGERVLYINMEDFSAFGHFFQMSYPADLSDLMYYFKQYPDSIHIKIKAVVEHLNHLDYIPPMDYSRNLRVIPTDDWLGLVYKIISFGMYDKIIIDVSNLLEDPLKILKASDLIYMPTIDNSFVKMKEQEFLKHLEYCESRDLIEKITKIKMPENMDEEITSDYFEKQLWGELGDRIRELLKNNNQKATKETEADSWGEVYETAG